MRRFHPEAVRLIESLPPSEAQGTWSVSRSGAPTVRRRGLSLVSAFDPVAEAAKAVPAWEGLDFAVLPGLGAGFLAEAVAARYPDLPLLIVEEDPHWFAEVLDHRDLTALWSTPFVVPLLGSDAVIEAFLRPLACRTVEVLRWRALEALSPDWANAVTDAVARAQAAARVNVATYRRFSSLWRRNAEKNESVADLRPLSALAGCGAGAPAVIAAAGPSLADRLDWIKIHRDRCLLIAVDTAWPALAAHGLEPDVLVILDGQYWNARHVDLPLPARTLVVTERTGPPRAFRLAPGRTFVAASSLPFLREPERRRWGELGDLPSGGSVATAAWSLARLLGCREVAFTGLDLGYPRGQTHVPGSQFEEAVQRRSRRLTPAETLGWTLRGEGAWRPALDGGRIRSDARMDLFRDWFSAAVPSGPRAVNLSTRGSVIPGMEKPSPGYGDDWVPFQFMTPASPPLTRRESGAAPPPFSAFERLSAAEDFAAAVETAWAAAADYWGTAVWEAWAGRAKRTWDRWPSPASRRAVEEIAELTLDWRNFQFALKDGGLEPTIEGS